jgi:hypothetical protein
MTTENKQRVIDYLDLNINNQSIDMVELSFNLSIDIDEIIEICTCLVEEKVVEISDTDDATMVSIGNEDSY